MAVQGLRPDWPAPVGAWASTCVNDVSVYAMYKAGTTTMFPNTSFSANREMSISVSVVEGANTNAPVSSSSCPASSAP